jgi:hypothetical protein
LKTWIHEAKYESKWNALISDCWESLDYEDYEDEDQHTESETEIPTTQEVTSLEEEEDHTINVFNVDESERTDRRQHLNRVTVKIINLPTIKQSLVQYHYYPVLPSTYARLGHTHSSRRAKYDTLCVPVVLYGTV